ncbi:MAG: hypothetical protein LYZ66_06325, partial [Nitrososphaerales archaeon]|nr:hypothetical protein [Nitrososphaerales archaeon]
LGVLAQPPTLTVGAPSTSFLTTGTFVATGSATEAVVNGLPTVSQSFTNTYTGSLSVIMWVSVLNSAGQTALVQIGGPATVAAGATATMQAALFNLPSGSYTATIFLTTSSGTVVSTTSTASSFTV